MTKIVQRLSPFQQGQAARRRGERLADNPYKEHNPAYNDWHDGHTATPSPAYLVRDRVNGGAVYDMTAREASGVLERLTTRARALGEPLKTVSGQQRFVMERQ